MQVPGLRGLRLKRLAVETFKAFDADDMWTYGSAVAYSSLFALFPFLILLLSVFSFIDQPGLFEWLLSQSRRVLPTDAHAQVREVVAEVRGTRQGGLVSLGLLSTLWIASGGVRAAMNALNTAYDVPEGRVWWKRYLLSLVYTVALGLSVVVATVLMVVGPRATEWVLDRAGVGQGVQDAVAWLRVPGALLLTTGALFLVYIALPNVRQRPRRVVPGAVLSVVLWALVSTGFQLYVSNFGRFGVTYGSVGAVIMLLAYFYMASLIVLLGAELNAVIQREAPRPGDAELQEAPPPDAEESRGPGKRGRFGRPWRRARAARRRVRKAASGNESGG